MKISVAMCTYEGAAHLPEQLDSVARQTRPPDELIVCDDRSSDATVEIVRAFAARAPFPVRLYVNEERLGSIKNFERAIGLCEGDIIALSDQDDVWLPEKLRRFESCFSGSPRLGLVFTDAEVADENLRPLGHSLWERVGFGRAEQRKFRAGRALDVLLPGWTVTGATMAFRAGFKKLVLEIPEDLALIHDGWIALVIAAVADVAFIPEPLIKYRQHAQQQIGAPEKSAIGRSAGLAGLSGVKEAARRVNSFAELIEIATRVCQRLAGRSDLFSVDEALGKLEARLRYLRTRASLPARRIDRLGRILRELLTLRYHLYSNGVHSAVKDLLI